MIRVIGRPEPPVPRLIDTLRARGHAVNTGEGEDRAALGTDSATILVVGPGSDAAGLRPYVLERAPDAPVTRVLALSLVGTHPDARSPLLQSLWTLEERARASGLEVLTLRLAPLLGPRSPLWLKLRARPALPRAGRKLLCPVLEMDVIETLERAIGGGVKWEGWYELAGSEAVTLAELAAWARFAGPSSEGGSWEPPIEVLEEQKLCDPEPWREHFGIEPARVSVSAPEWAA